MKIITGAILVIFLTLGGLYLFRYNPKGNASDGQKVEEKILTKTDRQNRGELIHDSDLDFTEEESDLLGAFDAAVNIQRVKPLDALEDAMVAYVIDESNQAYLTYEDQYGYFTRIIVDPKETVKIFSNLPDHWKNRTVVLEVQDGGVLPNGTISEVITLGSDTLLETALTVSEQAGIHKLIIRFAGEEKIFDFWVEEN